MLWSGSGVGKHLNSNHTHQGALTSHVALTHSMVALHAGFVQVRASTWKAWSGDGRGGAGRHGSGGEWSLGNLSWSLTLLPATFFLLW